MALTEEQRDRLAELRSKDVERDTETQDQKDANELEARELELALTGRGLKLGHDFKIVVNPICGVFAVRKPDTRATRNWENATEKQRFNLEWVVGLLRHYIVEPDDKLVPQGGSLGPRGIEWARKCGERSGLCWQTLRAFLELMGVDFEALQAK